MNNGVPHVTWALLLVVVFVVVVPLSFFLSCLHSPPQSYPCFLVKWIILQLLTISGSVSFLIFTVVQKELDLTQQLTTEVYVWFAVIGLLQIVSRVAPPCNSLIIDQLKGSLQVAHGTSVIKKIFEMEQ